ncbi:glycosyltransferase family 4 protein [Thalassotalea litorea]|uniref:Glycosyltransferase family 4 protein n=1 Tax=Thalassotalea litorea TaxID=2020715 RepID=A0A5R9IKJ2_9GAMM|nr:glycosyltransferase family 4 protein [Thalassotalea litorea]TLU65099.1 glycosyltransferase family 4 protein [Thalassotalea litorea]
MNKKLLFLVNVDWFFLSHRLPIALKALQEGYDVHLACNFIEQRDYIESLGIKTHQISFSRSGKGFVEEIKTLKDINVLFSKLRPEIVHGVTIKPVLYGGVIGRFKSIQGFVGAISGLGLVFVAKGMKAKIFRTFIKALYKLAFGHDNKAIIFQNEADRQVLLNAGVLSEQDCKMIRGSGADLQTYSPKELPQGTTTFIMAARLLKEKGVNEFIDAAREVKNKGFDARFLLVGDPDSGNPNSFTHEDLKLWEKEGYVEVLGHRTDIPELFSQSHVVVLPSFYGEGLPKVLIEAAACGRAIITTDNPGCSAAVVSGETGIIVPAQDVGSLVAAMEQFLQFPTQLQSMGKAGRKLAEEEFDVNSVVQQHLNIYSELMA